MPSSTRPAKTPVLVYAFHTPDEGGGFDWAPYTDWNYDALANALDFDRDHRNYETGVLVSLSIDLGEHPLTTGQVTEFIEGELQDAIEVGAVGHIIARYYRSA